MIAFWQKQPSILIRKNGQFTKLLYVQGTGYADFDYIAEKSMLIIPALEANEMTAYKLEN